MTIRIDLSTTSAYNLIDLHNMAYDICETELEAINLREYTIAELEERDIKVGITIHGKLYRL